MKVQSIGRATLLLSCSFYRLLLTSFGMNRARAGTAPRGDVKAFRREQLIDATMRTIARHGFARTTMAQVAKAAGLSQGIVNFYFKTKEALLYETLEHLAEEYEAVLQRALDRAGPEPVAALDTMIELRQAGGGPRIRRNRCRKHFLEIQFPDQRPVGRYGHRPAVLRPGTRPACVPGLSCGVLSRRVRTASCGREHET